jgi:hypothetical protein
LPLPRATGIWSKVRTQLLGKSEPAYSNYTVRALLRCAAKSAAARALASSRQKRRTPQALLGRSGILALTHADSPLSPSAAQCYTGIADFIPADIDTVGYRVFLGNKCAHARAHGCCG